MDKQRKMESISEKALMLLYAEVDQTIGKRSKVCKKGCFACCFQPIELFKFEKIGLTNFITNKMSFEQRNLLKLKTIAWLNFFDENTSKDQPLSRKEAYLDFKIKTKFTPCPLLNNGECSVYEVRPMCCRIHYVNDDKSLCEKDHLRDACEQSLKYGNWFIKQIENDLVLEVIPLAYAVAEILELDREMKSIETTILNK